MVWLASWRFRLTLTCYAFLALESVFRTAVALKNWPVAALIQAQTAVIATNRPYCTHYQKLAQEMLDIDTGMQAFIAGNYAMAVNHLLKAGQFIDASNTTIAEFPPRLNGRGMIMITSMRD